MFKYGGQTFDCLGEYNITNVQYNDVKLLLKDKKQVEIVDFDDHFMDSSMDWRNNFIDEFFKNK